MERVVAELQRLKASGEIVNRAALLDAGHSAVVSAAERYCGSFTRAVKLAGITYEPARPSWSRKRVLDEVRRLHRQGVPLNSEKLRATGHGGLVAAATKHFGNWRTMIAKSGLPAFRRGRFPTWGAVHAKLSALHARRIKMSISSLIEHGYGDLVDAAKRLAGSWNAALARAGIDPVMSYQRWTRADVIAGIRRLHASGALGHNIAIAKGERKLVKAAGRFFESWTAACVAAIPGYRTPLTTWTVTEVLSRIRGRHRAGKSVRSSEVSRDEPSLTAAARRLGLPWRDACRRANVPAHAHAPRPQPRTRTRWTEETIVATIRSAAHASTARPLLVRSFAPGFVNAVQRRYDSWRDAMRAAGVLRQYERDRKAAIANRLGGRYVTAKQRRGGRGSRL